VKPVKQPEPAAPASQALPAGEPELHVRVPIGDEGATLLARVRAQLDEHGLKHEMGPELPTDTTFCSLFERVLAQTRSS